MWSIVRYSGKKTGGRAADKNKGLAIIDLQGNIGQKYTTELYECGSVKHWFKRTLRWPNNEPPDFFKIVLAHPSLVLQHKPLADSSRSLTILSGMASIGYCCVELFPRSWRRFITAIKLWSNSLIMATDPSTLHFNIASCHPETSRAHYTTPTHTDINQYEETDIILWTFW